LGDTIMLNRKCWKMELTPKEDAPVVWGKIEAYIDQKDYLQLLIKYYDEDEYLVNTMVLSDIKELGGRTLPTHMEMIPAENSDQKTVIDYVARAFDTDQPDDFFSIQNLKRIR
jgi:outer membrane lipoprotein-sorting protein